MENSKPVSKAALRRQREREQRYRTILDAAETLFARKGYQQTSMDEIADQAEVSVGTVYFYFKKKEDLLIALLKEIGFDIRKLLGTEFKKAEASMDGLKNAGLAYFKNFCLQYPEKISIFFRESVGQSQAVEKQRKRYLVQLTGDITDALIRIRNKRQISYASHLSEELMAVCIVGIYERVACHYLLWDDRSEDIMTVARDAVSFTLSGVEGLVDPPETAD